MVKKLLKNRTEDFVSQNRYRGEIPINDLIYKDFILDYDGGYFYDNSLHIYGFSKKHSFHDIEYMNTLYHMRYKKIVDGFFFFGEDLFGNGYIYNKNNIELFNLESGKTEFISKTFEDFLMLLENDLDYLTGVSLARNLSRETNFKLAYGNRLNAKYPFILGGSYEMNNLVLKDFEENIEFNASIANQIYNLPDGSKIKINIK